MIRYNYIISLVFVFLSTNSYSQQYGFSHLNNTNGLSSNQVECIFKDSRGFMWFGTDMGLNRYDGNKFKVCKHIKTNIKSLPFDRCTSIEEDVDGNLWIESSSVYAVYDWKSESFIRNIDSLVNKLALPASPSIIEIDEAKNYYVYYLNKGIYRYDIKEKKATLFEQSNNVLSFETSEIVEFKVKGNYIWALHRDGLVERFDMNKKKIDLQNFFFKENFGNSTIKKTLFIDADNDLWIYPGIADKGIGYYSLKDHQWKLFDENSNKILSGTFVRGIGQDNEGLIWIATDHAGINIFDKKKEAITVLKNNIYNSNSISQNSIISVFCENNGTVWIGTYKNGVSYYHPNLFKFKKTPLSNIFSQTAEMFDCNSFYKDRNNILWIGTNGSGLIRYNSQTENVEVFKSKAEDKNSISSDIITSIIEDHTHSLWIGTFLGGLNAFDGKIFKRFQINNNNPNSLSSRSVYGIAEDDDYNLWIGTLGGGVDKLDVERNNFTNFNTSNTIALSSNYILSVFADPSKNLYLSTDWGISVIDKNKRQIVPYFPGQNYLDSLTNTTVNNIITDSRGLLWIATNSGINIYNPTNRKFKYITVSNGLPSDEVVSLQEDNDGNIWAGTRNGLACIYCKYEDATFSYSVAFFDVNDGLPGSVCNQNAAYKDRAGMIYIGTTKGYVCFNPKDIAFNKKAPQPRFTDLLIANQVITPYVEYNGRVIINKTIADLSEIILNYDETNFTILFSSLNFIHPQKSCYRYKLEGLEDKWTEVTNGVGAASYSNLNSGTYKLIVYGSNEDGVWTELPIILKIVVKPPFWLSWGAFVLYTMAIGGLLRLFLKYKLNKQRDEYEQAQKILEASKIHEVDELKFKFFTNISHEFKTPLTLIITPLEKLLKSPATDEQKNIYSIMYKNALNLLNMVYEILDFRKFDLHKMTINASRGNIILFTRDICQTFSAYAIEKSIKLTFTTYLEELQMEFDKEKMNRIVSNLISNAFKYTEEGQIDVSISITDLLHNNESPQIKQLCLKVSDTGIGIEEEYLDKIFERFFRIENAERNSSSGTGVGLHLVSEYVKLHGGEMRVESSLGKGTVFTVLLPILDSIYKELSSQDIIHSGDLEEPQTTQEQDAKLAQKANLPLLLIVDDNDDFCEFISSLFMDDYRIVTANDGEEGYRVVLDLLPDIILCDVMMPKVDGYEFCRTLKGDMRTSHIPIILLTAKSSEENKYSGIEAGADDYISKPFNIDMLILKIAKIIEKQRSIHNSFKKKIDISLSEIEITTMDEKFVKKAIAIVEQNIGNTEFLVEDLCKEMGMSRVYFYKKVLALTDKSPSEFIRFIRLKRATELLQKSQMFVNEIAFQVGFNDPKYFRKYFKEEFGVTPNEYKKKDSK